MENTVTILKKAGITEPEETANEREQLGKHVSVATNMHATIEEPGEAKFSFGCTQSLHTRK
jgi:hypothetical protein